MTNTSKTQVQSTFFERDGQLVLALNSEVRLSKDALVRTVSMQLEELDYSKLYCNYSRFGRKPAVDPKTMFKIIVYAFANSIFSLRKIQEACQIRIDFLWLLGDDPAPSYSTIKRFLDRNLNEIEDLFYQYVNYLEKQGETDHDTVFIDGTKLESRAGRYTFCWRGTVTKNLSRLKEKVFRAAGASSIKELQCYIDSLHPDTSSFVYGTGHRKTDLQREYEQCMEWAEKWQSYQDALTIMGPDRNSFSKTDPDATFMRMKEDHMRNGQLKPAYNVQIAVNSEYITGIGIFPNRTDVGTLIPFLKDLQSWHGRSYASITADSGYESLENYLWLQQHHQVSYIKPSNYEAKKKRRFKQQIGRIENMTYIPEEKSFVCAEGRKLLLQYRKEMEVLGQSTAEEIYRCENCTGCKQREACCRAKDPNKPKEVHVKQMFWKMRGESEQNICSKRGLLYRQNRSIQAEGTFGLIKNVFQFRRFYGWGKISAKTEILLLSMAFNLRKYWKKQEHRRKRTHLAQIEVT